MQCMLKIIFIAGFISANLAFAADEDTTKIYSGQEVVVTATRTAIAPEDAPAQVRLVSPQEIQRINGTTIVDIMQTVDGVQIMNYGATGGLKSISLRGLSSENISILLNGNPINDAEYGYIDLSLLPIEAIDRIEVSQGGSSALFGGDAAGGVVNIITRKASHDIHASIKGGVGSFGAVNGAFELKGRIDSVGMIAGVSQESGKDNFPFLFHRINSPDTTLIRTNADYTRMLAYCNGDYEPSNDISVNSFVHFVKFERGEPGSISLPSADARQNDEVFRAGLSAKFQPVQNISATLNSSYNHDIEIYREPSSTTDLSYASQQWMLNAQCEWKPISWDRVVGGAEYCRNALNVDGLSWGYPLLMSPLRIQESLYLSNECTLQNESEWFDRFIFYQAMREDYFSDVNTDVFSPKLGINIRVNKQYNVHIRGSWGQNFHVPTFDDLYYPNYSNPNLNPERSTTFDMGILGSLDRTGRQTLEITCFDVIVKYKIVYNTNYVPYNIGQAENSGIEARYDYHSADSRFDAYTGFSFVDARKKDRISETDSIYNKYLQYIPLASGVFGLSFQTEIGRISIIETYTGLRYIDAANINSLPAYALTDVNLMENISLSHYQLTINASIKNIFDTDYQSYAGYPMPGRSFKICLGLEY